MASRKIKQNPTLQNEKEIKIKQNHPALLNAKEMKIKQTPSVQNAKEKNIIRNPALQNAKEMERNEEWNNFVKRVGEVGNIVKDLASGDKKKAAKATVLADKLLNGKVIIDEDMMMTVKSDRTVINKAAFKTLENRDSGTMEKEAFMREMEKDANRRYEDRKIRREKSETFKLIATKAFRRGEFEKALTYYNKAIEQIKDNSMLYCDRALTNIKLKRYDMVFEDCKWALRINEDSFKARLYQAKAYKELEEFDKLAECMKELEEKFPQHKDLIDYFLEKKEAEDEDQQGQGDTDTIII